MLVPVGECHGLSRVPLAIAGARPEKGPARQPRFQGGPATMVDALQPRVGIALVDDVVGKFGPAAAKAVRGGRRRRPVHSARLRAGGLVGPSRRRPNTRAGRLPGAGGRGGRSGRSPRGGALATRPRPAANTRRADCELAQLDGNGLDLFAVGLRWP